MKDVDEARVVIHTTWSSMSGIDHGNIEPCKKLNDGVCGHEGATRERVCKGYLRISTLAPPLF